MVGGWDGFPGFEIHVDAAFFVDLEESEMVSEFVTICRCHFERKGTMEEEKLGGDYIAG